MAAPFGLFDEDRNKVYYHNIRIFIFGSDVTPWLTSNVTITKSDRDGTNSCSFTLSNQLEAFTIRQENIRVGQDGRISPGTFRTGDPYSPLTRYSELAKKSIMTLKTDRRQNLAHEVQTFGAVRGGQAGGRILGGATENRDQSTSSATYRYPLTVGSLVFHKYDPVRVFVQVPFNRGTGFDSIWNCEFTGYIDQKPYNQNYVNGGSYINVSCQDIRMLMQNMRTQINPAAQVSNENTLVFAQGGVGTVADTADAGFFNDLIPSNAQVSHVLGGYNWLESMKFLLLGYEADRPVTGTTQASRTNVGRVGELTLGQEIRYDIGKNPEDTLEKWNNLVNFGDTITFPNRVRSKPEGEFITFAQMYIMGQGTYHGGPYSPDKQKVHFLLPAEGTGPSNLIEFYVDGQIAARIEWSTRLELINSTCKTIDYQFYVNGYGDIIFEFPMYDFFPEHFSRGYNGLYTFEKHVINDNINDEGGTPISGLVVTSRYIRSEINQNNTDDPRNNPGVATPNQLKRTIFSNVLASRIGVHLETHEVPGVTNQDRLTQLGMIEFNKRLSGYDRFEMSASYRPYISVNRPIVHNIKERMGVTRSVTYTWRIREDAELSMDLGYVRRREADGRWRFITGGEKAPISYSVLYEDANVNGQGVNSSVPSAGRPKADPDSANKSNNG